MLLSVLSSNKIKGKCMFMRDIIIKMYTMRVLIFFSGMMWFCSNDTFSQFYDALEGETTIGTMGVVTAPLKIKNLSFTSHKIYSSEGNILGAGFIRIAWTVPPPRKIVDVKKKIGVINQILVLLDNGDVYLIKNPDGYPDVSQIGSFSVGGSTNWNEVIGDAIYVTSTYNVYVTRDTGATWQLDTVGLGANFSRPKRIALDSLQYVYLAHDNGLFKQHPDSNVWNKLTSFPHSSANGVFVDRTDKIFATSGSNLYYSTDYGATWTLNTTGLELSSITKFGDDAFGNVYATDGSKIFRSTGGTGTWTRIDAGITAIAVNPTTINSISGDSVLFAATSFGMFISADQGTTWASNNNGIQAENISGFAKLSNVSLSAMMPTNRYVANTSLGVFYNNSTETTWTKTYPVNGYSGGWNISRDGLGNLYIHTKISSKLTVFKSADGGLTWNADTTGLSATSGDVFIIDEQGNQHRATNSYGSSFYAKLYVKPYGGSWQIDTAGFISSNNNAANVMGSDRDGNIYVSGIYGGKKVWRRSAGGSWAVDSAGIPNYISYFDKVTSFPNGDMVAIQTYYLLQRNSTTERWAAVFIIQLIKEQIGRTPAWTVFMSINLYRMAIQHTH